MSRIFDALQRSVGEQSGGDSSPLPPGPELLREAERRLASDWETTSPGQKSELEDSSKQYIAGTLESPSNGAMNAPRPVDSDILVADEQAEILSRFKSLTVSITTESRLPCLTDQDSPTAEAVRLLAVRLRDIRRTRPLKNVLITSTIPREGKSTIAANLACALARKAEEKVLLIEGDIRLPVLMAMFGIERQPGLCELLRNESTILENIYHVEGAGIWILPAGSAPTNPLELLQSQRLSFFMDQLAMCFDWIVIDSPPVLPLADTSLWMRLADGVLLVTRQGVTEKQSLQKGLEALEPEKVLGALLNGSKASAYSDYYYGSSSQP